MAEPWSTAINSAAETAITPLPPAQQDTLTDTGSNPVEIAVNAATLHQRPPLEARPQARRRPKARHIGAAGCKGTSAVALSSACLGVGFYGALLACWAVQISVLAYVCRHHAAGDVPLMWVRMPRDVLAVLFGLVLVSALRMSRRCFRYSTHVRSLRRLRTIYGSWTHNEAVPEPGGWHLQVRLLTGVLVLAVVMHVVLFALFVLSAVFLASVNTAVNDPSHTPLILQVVVLMYVLDLDHWFAKSLSSSASQAECDSRRMQRTHHALQKNARLPG